MTKKTDADALQAGPFFMSQQQVIEVCRDYGEGEELHIARCSDGHNMDEACWCEPDVCELEHGPKLVFHKSVH